MPNMSIIVMSVVISTIIFTMGIYLKERMGVSKNIEYIKNVDRLLEHHFQTMNLIHEGLINFCQEDDEWEDRMNDLFDIIISLAETSEMMVPPLKYKRLDRKLKASMEHYKEHAIQLRGALDYAEASKVIRAQQSLQSGNDELEEVIQLLKKGR